MIWRESDLVNQRELGRVLRGAMMILRRVHDFSPLGLGIWEGGGGGGFGKFCRTFGKLEGGGIKKSPDWWICTQRFFKLFTFFGNPFWRKWTHTDSSVQVQTLLFLNFSLSGKGCGFLPIKEPIHPFLHEAHCSCSLIWIMQALRHQWLFIYYNRVHTFFNFIIFM